MATLNIKDFPDGLYKRLQARARKQRRSVAKEVALMLEQALAAAEPLSLESLRGLGKNAWRDTDAVAHVDAERRAWD
jgi:plasmid stability protein